ncbi:MAG: ABC transporter ATP-binding protein [Eubacteriales bacterium]|nr:ABC transporter ATP-binding protein [Eubacteriales bacterium]
MKDFFKNWRFIIRRYHEIMPHSMASYWAYHLLFMILTISWQVLSVYVPAQVVQLLEEGASFYRILLPVCSLGLSIMLFQVLDPLRFFSGMEFRIIDLHLSSCFMMGISSEYMNGPQGAKDVENISRVIYQGNQYGTEGMMRQSWDTLTSFLILCVYLLTSARLPWYWLLLLVSPSLARGIVTYYFNRFELEIEAQQRTLYYEQAYCDRKIWSQSTAKDMRLYHLKDYFQSKLQSVWLRMYELLKKEQIWLRSRDALSLSLNLVRDLIGSIILLKAYSAQNLALADVVLFMGIMFNISKHVDGVISSYGQMINNSNQVTPYRKFYDLPSYDEGEFTGHIPEGPLELIFEDVSFSYADKTVFQHLNLKVKAGEHIALVGNNGAGKTTLVKLASGLLTPQSGKIYLNGVDIQTVNPKERYARVAMVFQELELFAASAEENITLKPHQQRDKERLQKAILESGMEHDIAELPHGLDTQLTTYLDPEGVQLSGGQTQRLMLARALYKSGDLLILDEPTSALDPLAEAAMYQEYLRFTQDKTAIFISHRLSSTQFCDRVLFLENGRIVQSGTHEELMSVAGPYREMFETQAQYYREHPAEDGQMAEAWS